MLNKCLIGNIRSYVHKIFVKQPVNKEAFKSIFNLSWYTCYKLQVYVVNVWQTTLEYMWLVYFTVPA